MLVFILMTLFISKRFVKKSDFSEKTKKYINYFLIINLFGVLGYMLVRYNPDVPNWLYFMLSLPIGVVFLLFGTAVLYELFHFVLDKTPKDSKRRDFFKKSLDVGALSIATAVNAKAIDNARQIELEEVEVKLDGLKKEYKVVQLSDIHIGGLIDKEFISALVKRVNALEPNVVVITGDMVDTSMKYAKDALDELKGLKSTYGTYFIVGNHEYFHGVQGIIDYVNSLGIKVLENENVYIGEKGFGFNLAGVYDRFGFRYGSYIPDTKKALENKQNSPTILLAHQPKYIEEIESLDGIDLILSGHTHGGQIYPFSYLVKLQQPYVRGLNRHDETTQIYVNKGTGFWGPPMRLGASSEITLINLVNS